MNDLKTARAAVVGFVLFIFFTVLIYLIYKFTKMIRLYHSLSAITISYIENIIKKHSSARVRMTALETARVVVVGFVILLFIFLTVLIYLTYKFTKMIRLY